MSNAPRPPLFKLDAVRGDLQAQGVPESMIEPTISFMKLIVPLLIRDAGVERMVSLFEDACANEWNRRPQPAWARGTAEYTMRLAQSWLEEYRAARQDVDSEDQPRDDWERRLRSAATDCGVSLSNEAVSSERLYD